MRSKRLASSIGLALLLAVVAVAGTRAAPQTQGTEPPGQMTYQGHLMDADGAPVPDGSYMMTFAFYDAPAGGTLLWGPEDRLVDVNDGYFSALMGQTDPIEPSDLAATTYLEIAVSGETMTPRHQLTSVAFALVAGNVMSSTVSWNDLTDMPAGFADGVDDGIVPPDIGDFDSITMEDDGRIGPTASAPYMLFDSTGGDLEVHGKLAGGDTGTSSATGTNAFAWGYNCDAAGDYSSISGGSTNEVSADYTTIGGGSGNVVSGTYGSVGGGLGNTASGSLSTVGGGDLNEASATDSLVAGGHNNDASASYSTVAGGRENIASGTDSIVVGGYDNQAVGINSLAAGEMARANHNGTFVWADYSHGLLSSSAVNQFIVRASGGISMYTNSGATTGVALASGSGSWSTMSDRNLKENIYPVDGQVILNALAGIEINTWNYISQADSVRHVGPMAQDFYAAFGLGENDTSISAVDADGVALAAIQALYERVLELEAQVAACQCGGE